MESQRDQFWGQCFQCFSGKLQSTIEYFIILKPSPRYDANELDRRKLHSLIFVVALAHREKNSNAPLLIKKSCFNALVPLIKI